MKCFENFAPSQVNARREGDEILNSSVVAETTKLLANSSYGYHIIDRNQHTVTNYLRDEKTHSAIKNKTFERLGNINDQIYKVDLVKSEIQPK